jgi:hypothetical protein
MLFTILIHPNLYKFQTTFISWGKKNLFTDEIIRYLCFSGGSISHPKQLATD